MKRLDREFREAVTASIDGSGNVVVAGVPFAPVKILEYEQYSYDDAFLSWLNNEWTPIREDRLAEILNDATNKQRFDELSSAVKAERVVPFIGSGLSGPSGMPLWSSFLRQIRKSSTLPEAELEKLLGLGQFEAAASALLSKMPVHLFNERLEQTFRVHSDSEIIGAVHFVPEIFNETIVTTNFDDILEVIHRSAATPFDEILNGNSIAQFRQLRGKGRRCLLKIHGDHENPIGRVLTTAEYDAAYGPGCLARIELEHLFSSEPLLFMGCSLQADRTMILLQEVVASDNGTPRKYAFMKRPSDDVMWIEREHFLTERKIFPIWYKGDHDQSVEALLFGLR